MTESMNVGASADPASRTGNGEPIAIVGMACRFPGASDLDAFWELLLEGRNAVTEGVPGSGVGRLGDIIRDPEVRNDACRYGAFVDDIDQFDAGFFRISPAEAEFLDPQQRMMLETTWQALEDAGIDPDRLKGSRTGVYTGISNDEYRMLVVDSSKPSEAAGSLYALSGTNLNGTSGRVSFVLGLMGPAKAVDAACASAMVAVDDAVADLQQGKADVAIAAGVQAILNGRIYELRAEAMMLSPDGQCKTFDASANGYVRGEGCGVVVLKRLSDAEANGDHIWAVIRGSAVNNGGTSVGLTVPHTPALVQVMETALSDAGVLPTEVDYLEAHGTGTAVGDPIELDALASVYGTGRGAGNPLLTGSVKTNIGHLESAAGVAGLIKAALVLKRGVIPKHLHFENPNPSFDWDSQPIQVTTTTMDWPSRDGRPRLAGVNSFGITGTNAHLVLEEYLDGEGEPNQEHPAGLAQTVPLSAPGPMPDSPLPEGSLGVRRTRFLPLSGKSDSAVRTLAKRYLSWLDERADELSFDGAASEPKLSDMAWTAGVGRSHFDYRAGAVFHDTESLRERLIELAESGAGIEPRTATKVAFAYTGQGSQWVGMGRDIYETESVARAVLDRCEAVFREERGVSLLDVMFGRPGAEGDLGDTAWEQPALYALECALTALWASVGITPSVVLGHSVGEIAAAQAAGVFSLEDGMRFAATRGSLLSGTEQGAMGAIFAPAERVTSEVESLNAASNGVGLSIAGDNGAHIVVSGPASDVETILSRFDSEGVRTRRLNTTRAFHSALVEPALDELEASLQGVAIGTPTLTLVSNLTGRAVEPGMALDAAYWRRHARQPVAFADGVKAMADLGVDLVVEIGPHAVLGPMATLAWPEPDQSGNAGAPAALASLRRPPRDGSTSEAESSFVDAVAEAYEAGLDVSFEGLFTGETRRRISLPSYPFQRERHWLRQSKQRRSSAGHPLLGVRHESARGETTFETEVFPSDPAWLKDHRVFGRLIAPGALYGAMAATASLAEGSDSVVLEDMQLHSALVFSEKDSEDGADEDGRKVQVVLDDDEQASSRRVQLYSKGIEDEWTMHVEGRVPTGAPPPEAGARIDLEELKSRMSPADVPDYYRAKSSTGIDLGPLFRTLGTVWSGPGEALGEVRLPESLGRNELDVHPLLLDGCFQVVGVARNMTGGPEEATYLPFGWDRMWLSKRLPDRLFCHVSMSEASQEAESTESPEVLSGELRLYDSNGVLLGELSGYTMKRATREALLSAVEGVDDLLYEVTWRERPLESAVIPADFLPTPASVADGTQLFTGYLTDANVDPEGRNSLLADLERWSWARALATLEELGWQRVKGETVDSEELRERLDVLPEHQRLFRRMLEMVARSGVLEETDDRFVVVVGPDDPLPEVLPSDLEEFATRMTGMYPDGLTEIGLFRRSGLALGDVLRGQEDPLTLLFSSGEPTAADLYLKAPVARAANRMLADAVQALVAELPEGRRLRVIEVGAGTGSATASVLPELPDGRFDYVYTDISAGFFSEAEARFGDGGGNIEYRPLDIEKDPIDQGFDSHGYDLIIASNVLHATRFLEETLANCSALLAPSGHLIALENLRGLGWMDLTFGQLDGWWRFADGYRPHHALATPAIWSQALGDAGFEGVEVLGVDESTTYEMLDKGVIVAQGPAQITESPGVWVLAADDGSVAEELASELSARNQTVVLAGRDVAEGADSSVNGDTVVSAQVDAENRESWRSLIEGLPNDLPLNGVVHLKALGGHGAQAATTEMTEDVARVGASALALVQGVSDSDVISEKGVWFVTRGAQVLERERAGELAGAVLWGMGKVVALEAAHLQPRMIDLDPGATGQPTDLVNELLYPDSENHIAYRSGSRRVARLVRPDAAAERLALPDNSDWVLAPNKSGIFDKPEIKSLPPRTLEPKEVRVAVEATGINFWDVFRSLGFIEEGDLGRELCGHVVAIGSEVSNVSVGDRVVGLGFGAFGPEMITHEELLAPAPPGMSVSALATVPSAFVSAALSYQFSGLEAGERVLIHAGAGGVGLAAIQLAQAAGAEVFATASAPKQALLRSLGVKHIFDSRQTMFGEETLEATGGEGVHVVLNSLTSEGFIDASLACLAQGGRFVEMARRDILSHEEMAAVRPDVSYDILELDVMKKTDPAGVGVVLRDVMSRLSTGELGPIIHSRWPLAEAGAALDFMRSARHVGKIVLTPPPLMTGSLRQDRAYLVTGGLGGIGCAVAEWLADHGAGVIVLNGRRDPDPEAQEAIDALRSRGVRIEIELADVTDTAAIDAMLERIEANLPPLGGVIHSVGVLSDAALTNQTWASFEQVLRPKIMGAWHLHRATVDRDLDLFILFSSRVGVMGNPGQANHAAANAFLDQLAGHRRAMGLPGQAIAWGAWSEIGEAAEQRERIERRRAALGGRWFTPEQGIKALERIVRQDVTTSVVMSMDWSVFEEAVQDRPLFLEDMLSSDDDDTVDDSASSEDVLSRLRSAPAAGPEEVLVSFLQQEVQAVLRLSSAPSPTVGFFDLGMDSLMAVELRNRLNRAFAGEYVASNTVVFDYPDIASMASQIAGELGQLGEAADVPSSPAAPEPVVPEQRQPSRTDDDGIAVVGMAGRFPGANDLAEFWQLLEKGADAITDGRPDGGSWSGAVGDPDAEDIAIRRGAFVNDIDWFDSRFFRISPIEARTMDPQQRMLLETSWEALEDGGLDPDTLRGSRTGVYSGIGGAEYRDLFQAHNSEHNYLGTTGSVTVGRVAFALGLEGPALPVDMACASSLASVHQAVAALQRGEVDLALAGGVNAILSPGVSRFMMDVGMLSPTGHCSPFDASADGYVRGEGCGMVVLKRLSEAEADGDRIYAVIRGSAVNQNGASAGLTVPNGPAQERVMAEALAQAGASPSEVDYLEAHATGSQLGDPIELNAAASVYGKGRDAERPLLVGSVKSNIGHIESAAGIAAFIKTVLSMNKGVIPESLHLETPNPNFEWDQKPVRITSDKTDWPTNSARPPLAGVNAFGLSGTNAHVLVEGYGTPTADDAETGSTGSPMGAPQPIPASPPEQADDVSISDGPPTERPVRLLPLSGKSEGALRESAKRYLSWLDDEEGSVSDATLSDMAWTAGMGRSHFPHRAGLVFSDVEQLRRQLRALAATDESGNEEMPREATKAVFAFTGRARTWVGIGEALYRSEPVARAVLDRCSELLRQERGVSLLDVMFGRSGMEHDLNDAAWAEPATYALQCALTAQWASIGIRPTAVVAQGSGRIAAAQAAGVFDLEEGLRIAAGLGELKEAGTEPESQAASESLQKTLDGVTLAAPSLPLVSSVNGQLVESVGELEIDYWIREEQTPTLLSGHVEALAQLGVDVVVGIGPGSTMGRRISDAWPDPSEVPVTLSSLESPPNDGESPEFGGGFMRAVAQVYEAGLDISFPGLFAGEVRRRVSIPSYPFQRRRHWL
ncbi:MAG: SDR family NAD(P)-dependent oxidoreductase [Dehalococcoidia bacterium]|nr:SDR family NAD(P)-dependent oxidoreductase [Dehalococcoidia bacterium]